MKIYKLKKKMSIPKVAVLATGLTAAVLAASINPAPAQATPRAASCASCHSGATSSTTTAKPSTTTPSAGASYTVAIAMTANPNGGNSGYGIVPATTGTGSTFGGNTGALLSYTATMVAPAAAGTYSYTVWTNQGPTSDGHVGSAVYSITVSSPPVGTTPPTTVPPVVTPPTTVPPVVTPPTTVPPVVTPPTTVPPVVTPPTTVPPVVTPPTTVPVNPVSIARIKSLSVRHGAVGSKVTIRGSGFGTAGSAKFGTTTAKVSSWTSTAIVVTVPLRSAVTAPSQSAVSVPVWYRHGVDFSVTVTPTGATASNAVSFRLDSQNKHGDHAGERGSRHPVHQAGARH
jgi:hypothetical protein